MAESKSKLGLGTFPESGADLTFILPSDCQYYYGDGSSLIVMNNGTRIARDARGREIGKSVPRCGDQSLMNGLASSPSGVILRGGS